MCDVYISFFRNNADGRGFRRRRHNGAERAARRLARAMRQIPRAADAGNDPAPAAGADVNVNPVAGVNADPGNANANANANGAGGGNNELGAGAGGGAGGGGVLGGIRDEDVEELLRGDRAAGAAERVEQRAVEAAQRALVVAAAAAGAPHQQPVGGAGAGAGAAEGWMDRLLQWRAAARGGVAGAGGVVGFARGRAGGAGGGGGGGGAGEVGDRRGNGLVLALAAIGAGGEEDRGHGRQEG